MIYRTEYKGHIIVFWPIISSRSLWMASYNYLFVDGKLISQSGGFCLKDSALGEIQHDNDKIIIEMRSWSSSNGLSYELLVDGIYVDSGNIKPSYMKKEPSNIEHKVEIEQQKYQTNLLNKNVTIIDENKASLVEIKSQYGNSKWFNYLKKHGTTLIVLFACLIFYNNALPTNDKLEYKRKLFINHLQMNKSIFQEYIGQKVLVSFFNFYEQPYRDELVSTLKSYGIMIRSDDRKKVKDLDPQHPSNIEYCFNQGIAFAFSGSSKRQAVFSSSVKSDSYIFDVTEVKYAFKVSDLRTKTQKTLTLISHQKLRFKPILIYMASLGLWLIFLKRRAIISQEDKISYMAVAVVFCYLASSINSTGINFLIFYVLPLLLIFIIIISVSSVPSIVLFLWLSFSYSISYLLIKIALFQWDAVITIGILMCMASPFLVKIFVHIPYLRGMTSQFKNIEIFYCEKFEMIKEKRLIFYLPSITWLKDDIKTLKIIQSDLSLHVNWILAQTTFAIIIQLVRELSDPDIRYLIHADQGILIIVVAILKGVAIGFFGVLPALIAISFFCIRPLTLFRVSKFSEKKRQIISLSNLKKPYLNIHPIYLSSMSVLFGIVLLVSYYLPWINLQSLIAYFEIPIWQKIIYENYSGLMIAQLLHDNKYTHNLWPFLSLSLVLYGLIFPIKNFRFKIRLNQTKTFNIIPFKLPYCLLILPHEILILISYLFMLVFPSIVLICFFLIPLNIGIPGFIKNGLICTLLSLLCLQMILNGMRPNKYRKYLHNSVSILLVLIVAFVGYQLLLFNNKYWDNKIGTELRLSGFEEAAGLFLSETLFKNQTSRVEDSINPYTVVPGGYFIDGDLGHYLYSSHSKNKKITARWKYLSGFKIGRYEVTISEYRKFLKAVTGNEFDHPNQPKNKVNHIPFFWGNPGHVPSDWYKNGWLDTANFPVVGIDWWDAYAYCKWVNGSLPTTDQWEKAYRGINGKYWPWGNNDLKVPQANTCVGDLDDGYPFAAPIGSFKNDKTTFQVYDMTGNVSEWCWNETQETMDNQPVKGFNFTDRYRSSSTPAINTEHYKSDSRKSYLGFRCTKCLTNIEITNISIKK